MKRTFHVISNTHWDREWRFPFQRNRQMLVDMIDSVIDILMKEPDYKAFHLDSQSIVLQDYIEIRPHKKDELKKLIEEKRLFVGPWYILPDEFQVGGENLIRNLLLGHKVSKQLGRVSKIGYSPFSWGQISQLPQIYKEFGIDLIMFYRGINSIDSPKAEFLWEGADGTRSISSRFSTMPRYNFYFYIYRPVIHNEGFYDVEYNWKRGGRPFHFADNLQCDEDYFIVDPVDEYFKENITEQVNKIIADQANDFTTEHVIWMEGHDSSGPNIKTVDIIKDIKELMPELDVRHSSLEEYAESLYKSVDTKKLKLVKGERRSAQYDRRSGNMYGYTTSARMYLKQKNFDAERWIQFYAEPFNIYSAMLGRDINDRYPETAWEMIIQNSAHDSIGGCSLDEIHDDMMSRYKQSIEISKGVFERSLKHIVKNIDTSAFNSQNPNDDIFVTVFNPTSYSRSEVVRAVIDVPANIDKGAIVIKSASNHEIKFNLISRNPVQPVLEQMIDRPMYFEMIRYQVELLVQDIPPAGFKTLKIVPVDGHVATKKKGIASIKNGKTVLENEYLRVQFNENGSFNLSDKLTKQTFRNMGYLYDEGEAGHAWVNIKTEPIISTIGTKSKLITEDNSDISASVRIKHKLMLPLNLNERKRSKPKTALVNVNILATLKKNSKNLELEIEVDNVVESHRLRIMFPPNLKIESSFGEGQFDVVERSTERPDTKDWIEQPMYDFPMHNFVDVTDNTHGLAVIVDGLKEYEILDDKINTIAITLLRSFEYIIAPSSKQDYTSRKGSQCLGINKFRLALYPHHGNWTTGNVYEQAMNFNNQLRLVEHGAGKGMLPEELSFLKVNNPNIIISAVKKPESEESNAFVLRLFNPTTKKQNTIITLFKEIKNVRPLTLEETEGETLELINKFSFKITFNKKSIKTFKIIF